jgi:hypothetical protein
MKFVFPVAFALLCFFSHAFSFSVVKEESLHKLVSSIYKKQMARISSFLKTGGTQATQQRPSLRTESLNEFSHATLQFTYYTDAACATDPIFYNDYKINRCSTNLDLNTVEAFSDSTWTIKSQGYSDDQCTVPDGSPLVQSFKKNECYADSGLYVIINVMAEPSKAVPHGGNAFVVYETPLDCYISKHGNLGRSVFVASWPMGVCSYDNDWTADWKAAGCTNEAMTFTPYNAATLECKTADVLSDIVVDKTGDTCSGTYGEPVRFSCLADSSSP